MKNTITTASGRPSPVEQIALEQARRLHKLSVEDFERAIGSSQQTWTHDCHSVSLALLNSKLVTSPARIARGSTPGVPGQHSWLVLGTDCYDLESWIVDLTLWSYVPQAPGVLICRARTGPWQHIPHGYGSIFAHGKPSKATEEPIMLTPMQPLTTRAAAFLELLGPLDRRGWAQLANGPVMGWPAAEIIVAMIETEELAALVPIDITGMLTDRNPGGLYLKTTNERD